MTSFTKIVFYECLLISMFVFIIFLRDCFEVDRVNFLFDSVAIAIKINLFCRNEDIFL
jgi:hypothetical protein